MPIRIDEPRPRDLDLELARSSEPRMTTNTRNAAVREFSDASSDRHPPPERLAFYAGLRAQAANPTRTDAVSTAPGLGTVAQSRMDALRDAYAGPYTVKGEALVQVVARPMFRLNQGANEESMQMHAKTLDAIAARVGVSGASLRNGCAAPRDLVKVTQALIDAGRLPTTPGDAATRIRQMQWTWGIGVDCAGYTRRAFAAANGVSDDRMKALGLAPLGMEAFRQLDTNRHFEKVGPADVRTGDIITLDPKPPGRWGHNLVVHGNTVPNASTIEAFAAQHGPAAKAFLQGLGPYHFIQVDSSFGAGARGAEYGGYRRDTWIYDSSTKDWGYLDPTTQPASFVVSKSGPASDDDYHGAYRAKVGA